MRVSSFSITSGARCHSDMSGRTCHSRTRARSDAMHEGHFYAILKRIEMNKEYFDRAWKLQVRCTAIFGPEVEETFLLLQKARREVEVSAGMLYRNPEPDFKSSDNLETWNSF